jgi:hypothetical protein
MTRTSKQETQAAFDALIYQNVVDTLSDTPDTSKRAMHAAKRTVAHNMAISVARVRAAVARHAMRQLHRSYKVEVIADGSGTWCSNALRFATAEEADAYGTDLASRWTLVREWRVVATTDEVNR